MRKVSWTWLYIYIYDFTWFYNLSSITFSLRNLCRHLANLLIVHTGLIMKSKKPQMLWTETQLWTHRTETVFFEEGSVITSKKKLHPAAGPRKKAAPCLICRILEKFTNVSTPDYETPRLFHIPGAPGVPFKSTKWSLFGGVLPFWSHPSWKLFWVAKLIYQWSCLRRAIEDSGRFHSLQMTKQCSQRVPMRHHQNVPLPWPVPELDEAKPCLIHVD